MSTIAKVCVINQGGQFGGKSLDANRQFVMGLLDQAIAAGQPDIVCLPEAYPAGNLGNLPLADRVEPVPGPSTDACAERARRSRCYIVAAIKTSRDGRLWNSAVIIDRAGQIAGIYDKACPVTSTTDYTLMEGGVMPGSELPVFDLDFGRIGVQICFDAGFPENWSGLAANGARLVFWSSAYDGGFSLQAYAWLHHYYVASSVRRGRSRIIDPLGAIVEESGDGPGFVQRAVNLDYSVCHGDFNHQVPRQICEIYGQRVEVRNSAPGSGHYLVEPRDGSLTIAALADEFGFETTWKYHDRHREAYKRLRAGLPAQPQVAPHGRRDQYHPK